VALDGHGARGDRRRVLARLRAVVVLLLVAAGVPVGIAAPAWAACSQGQGYADVTSPTQTSATSPVGTNNTMTVTVVNVDGSPLSGYCVDFTQNTGPSSPWPQQVLSDKGGQASVTWSSSTTGTDSITAAATDANGTTGKAGTLRHTWTTKPTPSPTRTPSPKPSPTTSPTPSPTASPTPSHTPSPTPSPTTSPTPTATPSATASATPTATPTATGSPTPAPTAVGPTLGNGDLHLDSPSTLPGGVAGLRGSNCPAGSTVTFSVEGTPAGTATASPDGTFGGDVQLPDASIGEHVIQVACDGRTAAVPIDLVVSASTASPAAGATAVAVLVFFVLLGSVLLGRGRGATKHPEVPSQQP
jgi:hypothetical protein